MIDFVIDANVAVKWLLPEDLAGEALRLLEAGGSGEVRFHAPELWLAEVANVLRKRTRVMVAGGIDGERAARFIAMLPDFGVAVHRHAPLLEGAFALAHRASITPYDALYASLAVREGGLLATADDRLVDRLLAVNLRTHVVALRDVPAFLESEGA